MQDRVIRRMSVMLAIAIFGALLVSVVVTGTAVAERAVNARGSAYAASENALTDPNLEVPTAVAEVPPPPEQTQVEVARDRDLLLDVLLEQIGEVQADACVVEGAPLILQKEINFVQIGARGNTPADDADDVNNGPNDEDPQRAEVTPVTGFNDGCSRLRGAPSLSPSPSPTPTGSPSQAPFTPSPSASASPSPASTPTPATTTNCEDANTDPNEGADFTGPTCLATLPLWHARGYAFVLNGFIVDAEAEAAARCIDGRAEYVTGARFTDLTTLIGADTEVGPNQQFSLLGLLGGSVITFWETNWDPKTNTTTDGSDTVYVNAARIQTPAEEIILGHAEASVRCRADASPTNQTFTVTQPGTTIGGIPEGGFPRDVSLSPSKNVVLYSKIFSLSGSITPATQFQTPRRCVEGVTLTLRRDPIGGPEEFVDVGTVVTDQEGNYTFNYQADVNSQWLAFIDKDNPTDCAQAASNARPVLVKPFVKLKISQKNPAYGKTVRLKGIMEPCLDHPGTRMKLKRVFDSQLVEIDTKALDADCEVEFFIKANFRDGVFQTAWPKQDEDHQSGKSRPKVIRTHGGPRSGGSG